MFTFNGQSNYAAKKADDGLWSRFWWGRWPGVVTVVCALASHQRDESHFEHRHSLPTTSQLRAHAAFFWVNLTMSAEYLQCTCSSGRTTGLQLVLLWYAGASPHRRSNQKTEKAEAQNMLSKGKNRYDPADPVRLARALEGSWIDKCSRRRRGWDGVLCTVRPLASSKY